MKKIFVGFWFGLFCLLIGLANSANQEVSITGILPADDSLAVSNYPSRVSFGSATVIRHPEFFLVSDKGRVELKNYNALEYGLVSRDGNIVSRPLSRKNVWLSIVRLEDAEHAQSLADDYRKILESHRINKIGSFKVVEGIYRTGIQPTFSISWSEDEFFFRVEGSPRYKNDRLYEFDSLRDIARHLHKRYESLQPTLQPKLILIANSVDYSLAEDCILFLRNRSFEVAHVSVFDSRYKRIRECDLQ
jgi:hypothetical protein